MQISYPLALWASKHRKATMLIIGIICFVFCLLFFEMGVYLAANQVSMSPFLLIPLGLVFLHAWYSQKKSIAFNLSIFLVWAMIGNQLDFLSMDRTAPVSPTTVVESSVVYPVKPMEKADKWFKKSIRKIMKKRHKQFRDFNSSITPVAAFFLFFLLGVVAIAASFFLVVLACSLSCSGQSLLAGLATAATLIFFLGGLFLIGYSFYRAFKKDFGQNKAYKQPKSPPIPNEEYYND